MKMAMPGEETTCPRGELMRMELLYKKKDDSVQSWDSTDVLEGRLDDLSRLFLRSCLFMLLILLTLLKMLLMPAWLLRMKAGLRDDEEPKRGMTLVKFQVWETSWLSSMKCVSQEATNAVWQKCRWICCEVKWRVVRVTRMSECFKKLRRSFVTKNTT